MTLALTLALAADVQTREVGALVLEDVPETPARLAERIDAYGEIRSAGFEGFVGGDPAQGVYITTRFGETSQLHRVDAPGMARQQLTFLAEPIRSVTPSPSSADLLLHSRDVGGSEQYQTWLLDVSTGRQRQLSTGPERATAHSFSPDGSMVAWTQNLEGTAKNIVVAPIDAPEKRRVVFEGEGWWGLSGWTRGNQGAVLHKYVSAKESELHMVDFESGRTRPLIKSRKPIAIDAVELGPKGRYAYVVTDMDADRMQLWAIPLDRGRTNLLTGDIPQDVDGIELSPDGSLLAFTTNDEGRSTLHLRDTATWTAQPVPELPPGLISHMRFDASGTQLGFSFNRADSPSDVYSFATDDPQLVRWTHSEVGGLNTEQFVQPDFFRFPSFDERQIPAFVYRAPGEGPHPVVIAIHGGPEGQSRPWFSSTYQMWASLGITVVVPNVRGSTGFGREYHQLDDGLKRKDSVKDIGALLDWIGTQDDMDANRVVVYGGSYGGYMVLASIIDFSDRLAGAVDIVGISDFKTFLTNTKTYRRDLRRAEYGDERDPKLAAFFDRISPLNNADRIQDPLFVIQGANDPRVPASEARQIVDAVRANGHEAWYMLAMDEGHGFRKKSNRDAMAAAVVLYLAQVMDLDLQGNDAR